MPEQTKPAELPSERSAFKTIVIAGLIAGTLDILAAFINSYLANNVKPGIVLKYIASGVFGKEQAFGGGTPMIVYGLIFHFLIAAIWAVFFFLIYPYWSMLVKNKYVTGVLYGIFVWCAMSLIVLPMSNVPGTGGIKFPGAFISMGILIVAIGLPISIIVHRHYKD
jgi:magnesium-transporting ATPase (P-type)